MTFDDNLDYLPIRSADILKWDREWAFYISRFMNPSWFRNLAWQIPEHTRLKSEVAPLSRDDLFFHDAILDRMELHMAGSELVDKHVGEIGCGPGRLGRQLGHVAASYLGVDYSTMAISIARPLSPSNCTYVGLAQRQRLPQHYETLDVIVARHFFIHNNYFNATWVLQLAKRLLKPGGYIVCDFFAPGSERDNEENFFRGARDELDPESPSRTFYYSESDIRALADEVGLRIEESYEFKWEGQDRPEARTFVRMYRS